MSEKTIYILFWIVCLLLVLFLYSGCFQPRQPNVGLYDPLNQIGQAVKSTNWLVTVSILAIALSVAAVFNGSKIGLGALIGSLTSLTMALMVARYATVIAFVGLILAVGVLIYSIFIKNRALFEIFNTVEKAKEVLKVEDHLKIFNGDESIASKIQSPITKKVVNKLQRKLNGKKL